ncbi:hypothetical protein F511_43649 [Dorcoceras hygrometricum]|uniref:Uncharacterized protein n=1 Tax=Dorcoceras hygrometricum TaxID=472368 RepID=A0A2Z6ZYI3_9LAMI|nr:hypothetical protein F511_43649 [Dorcoceras hygrometricum]
MGKLALQRLNSYGLLIRSTTQISIPSPVCTRKPTKVSRTESPRRNGRNKFRRRRRQRRGEERKGENISLAGPGVHWFQVHRCGFIIIPIDDQIGPIYRVYKTEHYDVKTIFRTT